MFVQPVFTDPSPAGIERAYRDWMYEMGLAYDQMPHWYRDPGERRRRFDAAAIYQPRTVEVIEAEILDHQQNAIHYERSLRDLWRIRRVIQKRNGMARLDAGGRSERNFFLIRSTLEFLRGRRKEIAALNAEVEAIETTPPRETFSHHAAIAAE